MIYSKLQVTDTFEVPVTSLNGIGKAPKYISVKMPGILEMPGIWQLIHPHHINHKRKL